MNDLDRDIFHVGENAYAEASSEGRAGIRAQVHSVVNRHAAGRWYSRKTLAGTVMAAFAYSAQNTTDSNRVRAAECPMSDPIMQMCMEEAAAAIAGSTPDPTGGATHYYAAGTTEPSWVQGHNQDGERVAPPATFCGQIGKHLFYKDVT